MKVRGRDTEALLDLRSAITLIRPELDGETGGELVTVSCMHGDTWKYPTTHYTPRGADAK